VVRLLFRFDTLSAVHFHLKRAFGPTFSGSPSQSQPFLEPQQGHQRLSLRKEDHRCEWSKKHGSNWPKCPREQRQFSSEFRFCRLLLCSKGNDDSSDCNNTSSGSFHSIAMCVDLSKNIQNPTQIRKVIDDRMNAWKTKVDFDDLVKMKTTHLW
jgi:hypothetical protein